MFSNNKVPIYKYEIFRRYKIDHNNVFIWFIVYF